MTLIEKFLKVLNKQPKDISNESTIGKNIYKRMKSGNKIPVQSLVDLADEYGYDVTFKKREST